MRVKLLAFSVMATLFVAPVAFSQSQLDLGDEFIFFVDGVNVLVPSSQGSIVDDPIDPSSGNKALSFPYGDWASVSLAFDPIDIGADLSAMVSPDPAATKTLYLKLLVDPAMSGRGVCTETGDNCMSISFFDAVGGPQDRASLESGAGDPQMRLKWFIPEDLKDGQWHDLAIPLPPTTLAALENARTAGSLDPVQAGWHYTGAWAGGFGVGCCGSATPLSEDPAWQEFQWDKVSWFGIHYDFADGGGGGVFMDNVYIGDENTNLGAGAGAPAPMSGVTLSANGPDNRIDWTHNPDFGGYKIYADTAPITRDRLDAGELASLGSVAFNASEIAFNHAYEIPHPSLAPMGLYYAVTSLSPFGVENTDVSASSGFISNSDLPVQPYIMELNNNEADAIFRSLSEGRVASDGFPRGSVPFGVNSSHSRSGDGPLPLTDEDLSADVWVGFNREYGEVYVYAEIKDDFLAFHPGTSQCNGCETWGYDSLEFGWGSYDIRDVPGGSILGGSPHHSPGRGAEADLQIRLAGLGTGLGSTFVSTFTGSDGEGEVAGGATYFEATADGYRLLSLMPWDSFVFPSTGDAPFVPPAADAVKLIPFNIAINDGDGDGQNPRDAQMQWSTKSNAGLGWWNTPAMWLTVAVAGLDLRETYPFDGTFQLDLSVIDAASGSTSLTLGIDPDASNGFDAGLDQYAPPPPPAGAFDARLRLGSDDFTVDLRAPGEQSYRWDLPWQVGAGPLTVSWDPARVPAEGRLLFEDPTGGELFSVNMADVSSVQVPEVANPVLITYSLIDEFSVSIGEGWNMLGLPFGDPVAVETAYPNALGGSFFGFQGSYQTPDPAQFELGEGYWLRFPSAENASLSGLASSSVTVSMDNGWNMISGPFCSMPVSGIDDPGGVLLAGTSFGFTGSYQLVDNMEPGAGYWLRASGAGDITLDCAAASKGTASSSLLASFAQIEMEDARGNRQTLYLGGQLSEGTSPLAFTAPPMGPTSPFRATFDGDRYVAEKQMAEVMLSGAAFPITISSEGALSADLLRGDEVIGSVGSGPAGSLVIEDPRATRLRLRADGSAAEVPEAFALEQNYPNPFNPITTIRFGLPESSPVTLEVFDALGRRVAQLLRAEERPAGWHHISFDARNLTSGTYFYRIQAGQYSTVRRMVLMK